jgi:photosystem I P700 chlorophyll a apoprotein A2
VAELSQLINGYNPYGMNNLAVWAWMFLFGHLVWATGFMFLISWRGYWQELIETLVWAHERTPLANLVRWKDKPVALSIVQARLVGLAHFHGGVHPHLRGLPDSLDTRADLAILVLRGS